LTDVVMPEMGGVVLVEAFKKKCPDLKVIFMSGYTDNSIAQKQIIEPGTPFIMKPFKPAALSQKVREALDKK